MFLIHQSLSIHVQQSGGTCRLILDLSYLNRFIWKQSVRFEDIRTVFDLFQSGYFFLTFDLKSDYLHVEIFPDLRQYLGFSWNFGSVVKYFVFTVLHFGLSSAPYWQIALQKARKLFKKEKRVARNPKSCSKD